MATLLDADLPSDEEDDDYEPTAAEVQAADEAPAISAAGSKRKHFHRGQAAPPTGGPGTAAGSGDDEGGLEPVLSHNAAAKKAKVDSLWDQLNHGKAPSNSQQKPAAATKTKTDSSSLASLCRPVPKKKSKVDKSWMAQLGLLPKKSAPAAQAPQVAEASGDASAAAAGALAAAQQAASRTAAQHHGKVAVLETRRFAGKDIQVERSVTEADAKKAEQAKPSGGLDAMLQSLQEPKKVNVLDKSRQDWSGFKKEHTAVEEELETYKKSGDKYLDKVDFLQRAEVREYEKERDQRLARDVRNRGRL